MLYILAIYGAGHFLAASYSPQAQARASREDHPSVLEKNKWRKVEGGASTLNRAMELGSVEEDLQKAGMADHSGQSPRRYVQRVLSNVIEIEVLKSSRTHRTNDKIWCT